MSQATVCEHGQLRRQCEVCHLTKELRVAEDALQDYDDTLAYLREPGRDNDGGPASLLEAVTILQHNWGEAEGRVAEALAEIEHLVAASQEADRVSDRQAEQLAEARALLCEVATSGAGQTPGINWVDVQIDEDVWVALRAWLKRQG